MMFLARFQFESGTAGPLRLALMIFNCFMCFQLMMANAAGTSNSGRKANQTLSCSAVRATWTSKGLGSLPVPATAVPVDGQSFCSRGRTCCTKEMEEKLQLVGKQEFLKMSNNTLASIHEDFVTKSTKFRVFSVELVENSTKDLHNMFQKTYGLLYLQNAQIFADLFRNLQKFLRGRDLDLHEALEQFFSVLFQRMFALLNTSYDFDKKYLDCVAVNMDGLKPFGDVPQKLSVHVRRAFVAAVTFMQGLRIGKNALHRISRIESTDSCSHGITRMLYCPLCRNLVSIKPCLSHCKSILGDCFHYSSPLNGVWNEYIDAMLKVADRLEGPFNIESVIEPLDVKISDAIMNFQENSEAVTAKVFQECGQPTIGSRRKRHATGHSHGGNTHRSSRPSSQSVTALDQMLMEVKEVLVGSKDFWQRLTSSVCRTISAPLSQETNCWDGKNKIRSRLHIIQDEAENVTKSPEANDHAQKSNPMVEQQLLQLKLITSKLHDAYTGQEVNWMDMDDDDMEDDDDDDEREDDFSGGNIISPTSPLPPPHHRHHRPLKNSNRATAFTMQPWVVHETKQSANVERGRTQPKKLSRNASSSCIRPFCALHTLKLILIFSVCISIG